MADGNGGRTALVTGASGGIGAELAKLFARDGWDVVLVARSRDGLEKVGRELGQTYGAGCHVVPADLADPAAPQAIYDAVQSLGLRVDALVNNAGFGLMGSFVDTGGGEPATELGRELEMLQVNVVALTHLSKLFLPAMVRSGRGYLMNVASTAAFQPGPLMAVYYASKAYVLSFSEALSVELAGTDLAQAVTLQETFVRLSTEGGAKQQSWFQEHLNRLEEKLAQCKFQNQVNSQSVEQSQLVIERFKTELLQSRGRAGLTYTNQGKAAQVDKGPGIKA